MIPKKIHYCWFGGKPLPKSARRCISSWKKHCPDFEIIRWDEESFDINCNAYCKEMYRLRKWAFLTDYIRLKVIYENGGIYFDTDVELLKPLNTLLNERAFMGMETTKYVNTGLGFGAEKGHPFIRENMEAYEELDNFDSLEACPTVTTRILEKYGIDRNSDMIQQVAGVSVYPKEFFCAKDTHTGIVTITEETISIHHFDGSWNTKEEREATLRRWKKFQRDYLFQKFKKILKIILGKDLVILLKRKFYRQK